MSRDIFDLSGQVAVVTGGGTGIGRATAKVFTEFGARPSSSRAARRRTSSRSPRRSVELGGTPLVVTTDVRKPEDCQHLVDRTIEEFGQIDILVNNAGGSHSYPLESWTLDGWANMIDLNLRSVFLLSQAAAKHMMERGRGAIVNISSGASQLGLALRRAVRRGEGRREQPDAHVRGRAGPRTASA